MTEKQNMDLCLALLQAENENEIIDILKKADYWEDNGCWEYFGGMENNWGIIGNQQSKPEAALVEKIVNSVDAVLMRECLYKSIDPESDEAPKNINKAAEIFFNIKHGNLADISPRIRTEISKEIGLIATGKKNNPNYIIFDKGEGQEPNKFKDTLLSLNKSNKLRIPFVQGTYNQGGTGVIRFCGKNHLQLIISKRYPGVKPKNTRWGFTVIRRQKPTVGIKHSVYTYLAPKKEILSFDKDEISLLRNKKGFLNIPPIKMGNNN